MQLNTSYRRDILTKEQIRKAIEEIGLVEEYLDLDIQLQPLGFDLTVGNMSAFGSGRYGVIDFSNKERYVPKTSPEVAGHYDWITLKPGKYKIRFAEKVNLPRNIYAVGMSRSTLLRCGCAIHSAVWDTGFSGYGEVLLDVGREIQIGKRARVFQLQFLRCDDTDEYTGIYNEEN